jgi:type IV pilus assembly protein PilA
MKSNKGFTLIELLAIIVILAIIAVITVPIILNIIENSRMGAATNSAYGYVDAVDKHFLSAMMDGSDANLNGTFSVSNGKLSGGEYLNEVIPLSGTLPSSGTLTYSNNVLQSGCLVMGEYAVTFNPDKSTSTEVGECSSTPDTPTSSEPDYSAIVSSLSGSVKTDGYKYLTTPEVVYYNPTIGEKCSDYDAANSAVGNSTGCMKWYAYSVKDNVVNMILDHNINTAKDAPWVSSDDYSNSATLGPLLGVSNMGSGSYGDYGNHDKGPLTALNKLKTLTNGWTTSIQGDYSTYTAAISDATYGINYSGYKSRLITAQEVAYIVGNDSWDEKTSTSYFYFGSKNTTNYSSQTDEQKAVQRSYSWLFDNLYNCGTYGCENSSSVSTGNFGYWSLSPVSGISDCAWYVYSDGNLYGYRYVSTTRLGVRPVINVSTSLVFS